jgi:hypothetical protein
MPEQLRTEKAFLGVRSGRIEVVASRLDGDEKDAVSIADGGTISDLLNVAAVLAVFCHVKDMMRP